MKASGRELPLQQSRLLLFLAVAGEFALRPGITAAATASDGASVEWWLGSGGVENCHQVCAAAGERICIPIGWPTTAQKMQQVANDARQICSNIAEHPAKSFVPAYQSPSAGNSDSACLFATSGTLAGTADPCSVMGEEDYKRFCPCAARSEQHTPGLTWVLAALDQACTATCSSLGGVCSQYQSMFPVSEAAVQSAASAAGASCRGGFRTVARTTVPFVLDEKCYYHSSLASDASCEGTEPFAQRLCPCFNTRRATFSGSLLHYERQPPLLAAPGAKTTGGGFGGAALLVFAALVVTGAGVSSLTTRRRSTGEEEPSVEDPTRVPMCE